MSAARTYKLKFNLGRAGNLDEDIVAAQEERQRINNLKRLIAQKGKYSDKAIQHLEKLESLYEDFMREYTVGDADRELLDILYLKIYQAIDKDIRRIARRFHNKTRRYLPFTIDELAFRFYEEIYTKLKDGGFDREFFFGISYRYYLNWIRKDIIKHHKRHKTQLNYTALDVDRLKEYIASPVLLEKVLMVKDLIDGILYKRGLNEEERKLLLYLLSCPDASRLEQAEFLQTTNRRRPERIMQRIKEKVSNLSRDYEEIVQEQILPFRITTNKYSDFK